MCAYPKSLQFDNVTFERPPFLRGDRGEDKYNIVEVGLA